MQRSSTGVEVTASAYLLWSVKESFFDYVAALDDGSIEWEEAMAPGRFPLVSSTVEPPAISGRLQFGGGVRLRGHRYMLNVELRDPIIDFDAATPVLRVPEPGEPEPTPLLDLGEVDIVDAGKVWLYRVERPTLTFDGSYIFGGNYGVGAVFDPVTIELPKSTVGG